MRNLLFFVFFVFANFGFSQSETYGIQMRQSYKSESINCSSCKNAFDRKIREIQFSIEREGANLYFRVNDKDWFKSIFSTIIDGMAIDVVAKERYDCDANFINSQIRGKLLKPIYYNKLMASIETLENDEYRVMVGKIPANLLDKDLEYNILFIGNKTLCRYQTIFNIQAYSLDLLDMGMYLDSIRFENKKIGKSDQGFKVSTKTMRFKIPFQKNKSTYKAADIKSLYDSLNLTNFNIKTIAIKAYASVEGSLVRNLTLQNQRASSIVEALQYYQKPTIKTDVSTAENWVEFLTDIELSLIHI